MIGRAKRAWDWFIGGLTEAALWLFAHARRPAAYRVDIADGAASIRAPDGAKIGTMVEGEPEPRFEPATIAQRLVGAAIAISVPPNWLFRRALDPIALQSVPFLDAFVRHHIERVTPWRAADVHYEVRKTPLRSDPTRVAVDIVVVPRRLVKAWVPALQALHPRRLTIVAQGAESGSDPAIQLGDGSARLAGELRQRIAMVLIALILGFSGAIGFLWWELTLVQADIEDQDRLIEDRKAVMARAQRMDRAGQDMDAKLRELRRGRPRAVDVIEALAAALPDSAHLTDLDLGKDRLTIGGIAADTSLLVPALEKSGRFADVAFEAATTKVETGGGDRFHLAMRVISPAPAAP